MVVLNSVINGALEHNDMQRALGMYQAAPDVLGVMPGISTLNVLLQGCIRLGQSRMLADRLLDEARTNTMGTEPIRRAV